MVVKNTSLANRDDFLLNCPACGRVCKVRPSEVGKSNKIIKIFGMDGLYIFQCDCGNRFNVKLDFRRKPRYDCSISSYYTSLSNSGFGSRPGPNDQRLYQSTINSVIKNISVDGIGLISNRRHDIQPEDELLVTFTLRRGAQERLLERRLIVRTVNGNYIGGEFFPADKKKPEIGFYLMEE